MTGEGGTRCQAPGARYRAGTRTHRADVVDEGEAAVPGRLLLAADVGQAQRVALLQALQSDGEHVHRVEQQRGLRLTRADRQRPFTLSLALTRSVRIRD